jgi:Mrp family chromosome partitioning ATPase
MHEVIHEDQRSKINVVGLGNFILQKAGVAHERLRTLVEVLSDSYDYLLIDCGDADINGLAQVADAKTVVIVSAVRNIEVKALEGELLQNGYPEAICIYPTENEIQEYTSLVA